MGSKSPRRARRTPLTTALAESSTGGKLYKTRRMPRTKSPNPTAAGAAPALDPVTPETGRPLYVTTRDAIRRAVDTGRFQPGQQMPSTAEVSRQLNVSLVTAHRALQELVSGGVLRRSQGRGTFVRDDVLGHPGNAGEERVNVAARARVGLVLHRNASLADHYHGRMLEGVRRAAHDERIDLIFLRFGEDLRSECGGLLCVNPLPEVFEQIVLRAGRERPCVVVGARPDATARMPKGCRVGCVDADNADVARQAVEHLRSLGHAQIGFVGGGDDVSNSRDRWQGFADAADPREADVVRSDGWRLDEAGRERLVTLLRTKDAPTALFAAGYYFALDVYAAAAAAGRTIGRDLALVGVDDPPSAEHLSPPLTTVRQPLKQIGDTALRLLLSAMDGGGSPGDVTLSGELVARDSTLATRS